MPEAIAEGVAEGAQIDPALQRKRSFHGRSQSQEHQTAEQKQATEQAVAAGGEDTGIGYFFRNFFSSVFVSTQETKSKAELVEQLAQEEASLKGAMQEYIFFTKKG